MPKPTNQDIYEALEILKMHAAAERDGIAYETRQDRIVSAGWDCAPPTWRQVADAKMIVPPGLSPLLLTPKEPA